MRKFSFVTVAVCLLACTHLQKTNLVAAKSENTHNNTVPNTLVEPVVAGKQKPALAAPELPFFKDILHTKRLFW